MLERETGLEYLCYSNSTRRRKTFTKGRKGIENAETASSEIAAPPPCK